MSLRAQQRPPTPHPVAEREAWVWSAIGGLKLLSVGMDAGGGNPGGNPGKRKAEGPPAAPSRDNSASSVGSEGESVPDDPIQLIVINFDGTMTRAKPFIRDPTLFEASKGFITTESLRGFAEMTDDEHLANFGGQLEVDALKEFFQDCRDAEIQVYLVCDGKAKAANRALEAVEMHGLVTGVIGSTDEPFKTDPDIGKYAAVELLQKELKLRRTQILWVASKTPDIESVAELGIAALQINFDDGLVVSGLEDMRLATGLLNDSQQAALEEEQAAAEEEGMQDFLS